MFDVIKKALYDTHREDDDDRFWNILIHDSHVSRVWLRGFFFIEEINCTAVINCIKCEWIFKQLTIWWAF